MYIILVALLLMMPIPLYFGFKSLFKVRDNQKAFLAIKDAYKRVKKRYRLSISEAHRFGNRLIAIDRNSGRLVLIVYKNGITWEKCLNLDEIIFCRIVKDSNNRSGSIQMVRLELTLANNQGSINFSFFDEQTDDFRDLPNNLKRAKYWKKKIQYHLSALQITSANNQLAVGL
jgi:hypothetical protein